MNKSKEKRNKYNHQVINELALKHGITIRYVRMCLCGDRKSLFSDKIVKEYKAIDHKLKETLTHALNQ